MKRPLGRSGRLLAAGIALTLLAAVGLTGAEELALAGASSGDITLPKAPVSVSGILDPSFGTGGTVVTDAGPTWDSADAVAMQGDGKILLGGHGGGQYSVSRLNPDGSLDPTFGDGGKVASDIHPLRADVADIALQPDGKIVVVGGEGMSVSRYDPDGTLDSTFSGDGTTWIAPLRASSASTVALQTDGKIIVGGYAEGGFGPQLALARLNSNGSVDTTFSGDGVALSAFAGPESIAAQDVAIQPGGRLVAVGTISTYSEPSALAVVRFRANGSLDTTFDTDGQTVKSIDAEGGTVGGLALQPDGKIVVAATANSIEYPGPYFAPAAALMRLQPSGALDASFGSGGTVVTTSGWEWGTADGVALQADGGIVTVGRGVPTGGGPAGFAVQRHLSDGTLDPSFDGDGVVVTSMSPNWGNEGHAATLQPDGKIVVAGESVDWSAPDASGADFAVVRYRSDGSLDPSFGIGGKQMIPIDRGAESWGEDVAVQADGKLVVGGGSDYGEWVLVRYLADGSLDPSFGGDGKVATYWYWGNTDHECGRGEGIAIQPDGKIVMVGGWNGSCMARYLPDGSPDPSFDGDGLATSDLRRARDVAIQEDGKIVIVGTSTSGMAVLRLNPDGSPDTTFSGDGQAPAAFAGGAWGDALAMQPDGKIVVGGNTFASEDFGLARFNPNGSLDAAFDSDGRVTFDIAPGYGGTRLYSLALQPDGKIVAAGTAINGYPGYSFALARFDPDGGVDTSFGDGGGAFADFTWGSAESPEDEAHDVMIQPDGKIVAVGRSGSSDDPYGEARYRFALARFDAGGKLDGSFGDGGTVLTAIGSSSWGYGGVLQPDGGIVVAGAAFEADPQLASPYLADPDFAVARYLSQQIWPLTAAATADDPQVDPGSSDGYTLAISNPNDIPLDIASITDTLPDGFAYSPGSTSGATSSDPQVSGRDLTWDGPFSVPAHGSISLHFGVTVASAPGEYYDSVTATAPGVAVTPSGPTAPIIVGGASCQTSVTFASGKAQAQGTCLVKEGGKYTSTGHVRVNGVDFYALADEIVIDTARNILEGDLDIRIGGTTVSQGPVSFDLDQRSMGFHAGGSADLFGLPVEGSISLSIPIDGQFRADLHVALPPVFGGVTGDVGLVTDNASGLHLDTLHVAVDSLLIGGRLEIRDFFVDYEVATDTWRGGATVVLPGILGPGPSFAGSATLTQGRLTELAGSGDNLGIPLGPAVTLQKISFAFQVGPPMRLSGEMDIDGGPVILGNAAISIDGNMSFPFSNPGLFTVRGSLSVVGNELLTAYAKYWTNGNFEIRGDANWIFVDTIALDGWVQGNLYAIPAGFNLEGEVTVRVHLWTGWSDLASVNGLISNKGAAGCLGWLGGGYRWGESEARVMWGNCGVDEYRFTASPMLRAGMRAPSIISVPPGLPVEVIALTGDTAPPLVTITGPGGESVTTDFDGTSGDGKYTVLRMADKTTYVGIESPTGGDWAITVEPGSSTVTEVKLADGLPQPEVTGDVTGGGATRVLDYSVKAIDGQEVTFVEQSEGTNTIIGDATGTSGAIAFTPAPGPDTARKVVALVEQNGLPRASIEVASYHVEAPALVRPCCMSLTRKGTRVTARWGAVAGATRYLVTATLADGRVLQFLPTKSAQRIGGVQRGLKGKVTVAALNYDNSAGPQATARLGRR